MPRTDANYNNTVIYKVVCNDLNIKEIYISGIQQILDQEKISIKQIVIIQKQNLI